VAESRLLRRIQGVPTDVTPVWLMRQAGRYMPSYRALRQQHSLLELIKTPELAVDVTLQPVNAFDLDAAIIFSDILPPLEGMGLELSFLKGEGPVIHNPVRTAADIAALRTPDPRESLCYTLEAIRLVRTELDARGLPLIGFAGAPFTLACYAIEGGKSRYHENTRILMLAEPDRWHELMTKLATVAGEFLLAQAEAGADVLNIFDTWVGELASHHYRDHVLPYVMQMIDIAARSGKPIILFGVGSGPLLDLMATTGATVIGIDWRTNLQRARFRTGPEPILQGNLDPVSLLAPWDVLRREIDEVFAQAEGDSRFIFNLGHGVLPQTPVDNVRRLVDYVHQIR
jgi:uroporphyrinogen decarboxylase